MSNTYKVGSRVQVADGTTAPDLPDYSIAGWTGTITELGGKKTARKYFIQWDDETLANMPADYLAACEEKQLYHLMACLTEEQLQPVEQESHG